MTGTLAAVQTPGDADSVPTGADQELPTTAFLVLGILAAYEEQLTAGEIKTHAEFSLGQFYWSPSVSHIRRELTKLLERDLVRQRTIEAVRRPTTLYEATPKGEAALREWVRGYRGGDQVVIKHPVILKTWLASDADIDRVLETIDGHLESTRRQLDQVLWAKRRSEEVGANEDPKLRLANAVLHYSIRQLYGELSNIEQLRDEVSRGTDSDPVRRVNRPKGTLRRRGL